MPLALILVRWLHLSASILLASLFLFEGAIVLPVARKPSAGIGQLLDRIQRLTFRAAMVDASGGDQLLVRLELAGRLHNERRRLN